MDCLTKMRCVFLLFCIIHCSVVLGVDVVKECMNDVHAIFPKRYSPRENFLHAFEKLNLQSFYVPKKNMNALGYFNDLLKRIGDDEKHRITPYRFCSWRKENTNCYEGLYMLLGDRSKDQDTELLRVVNMKGNEVFKHVYMTQIYNRITFDRCMLNKLAIAANYIPNMKLTIDMFNNFEEYDRADKQMKLDIIENKVKFGYITLYLDDLLRVTAKAISKAAEFANVEYYCRNKHENEE